MLRCSVCLLFRYLQDAEVVDDVLQESYMKLWINRSKIGSVKSPRNYFFSIIKNTIADKRDYFSKGQKGAGACGCFGWGLCCAISSRRKVSG